MSMKMTMAEFVGLEPCPFCKGEAFYNPGYNGGNVECRECGAEGAYKPTEAEAIAAWNSRATCGTITAEQVEDAVYRHCKFYEGGEVDAQAIADELNSRAERTCEFKPFRGPISDTDEEGDRKGVCSECSAYMHEQFNYCPNCGCKVIGG